MVVLQKFLGVILKSCLFMDRFFLRAVDWVISSGVPMRFFSDRVRGVRSNISLWRGIIYSLLSLFVVAVGLYCGDSDKSKGLLAKPDKVSNFEITSGNALITISWDATEGASEYKIFMDDDSGTSKLLDMPEETGEKSYSKPFSKGLEGVAMENGIRYAFQILARNSAGEGDKSDKAYGMPRPKNLGTLGGLRANPGSTQATLTWDVNSLATKYIVHRKTSSDTFFNEIETVTKEECSAQGSAEECMYVDTGLTNNTNYNYKVIAVMVIDGDGLEATEVKSLNDASALTSARPRSLSDRQVRITHTVNAMRSLTDGAQINLKIREPISLSAVLITGYEIETLTETGGPLIPNVPVITIRTLSPSPMKSVDQPYGLARQYRVTAQSGQGQSIAPISDSQNTIDVPAILPDAPTVSDFMVSGVTAVKSDLSWSTTGRATHYTLQRTSGGSTHAFFTKMEKAGLTKMGSKYTFTDTHNLGQGQSYAYDLIPVISGLNVDGVQGIVATQSGTTPTDSATTNIVDTYTFAQDVLQKVDTFVGVGTTSGAFSANLDSFSRVVPAASRPFGLVRVSAVNTRRTRYFWYTSWRLHNNSNSGNGYYDHTPDRLTTDMLVQGFSMNSLSGPGCPVKFDFPFMITPGTDTTSEFQNRRAKRYSGIVTKEGSQSTGYEVKKVNNQYLRKGLPGYLKYTFKSGGSNPNMDVEFTVSRRAGIGKFTFHGSPTTASAIFTSYTSSNREDASNVSYDANGQEISGLVHGGEFCNPGSNAYKIYMVAKLSQNVVGRQAIRGDEEYAVQVNLPASKVLYVKFALSYTSYEKARLNLAEIDNFNFDKTKKEAEAEWAVILSTVAIKDTGRASDKKIFYSALWRMFQHPTIYQDIDGSYRGFDNKVHNISEHTTPRAMGNMYTDFSGWDIYRFQTQLLAFLMPEAASDMAQSLTIQAEQTKMQHGKSVAAFPRWTVGNDDALMMHGNPGQIIVANMYAFGARNFDIAKAWNFSKSNGTDACSNNRNSFGGCLSPLSEYRSFLQNEKSNTSHYRRGVYASSGAGNDNPSSKTLEYTTAEFAKAQLAKAMYDRTPATNTSARNEYRTAYNRYAVRAARWREVIRRNRQSSGGSAAKNLKSGASFYEGTNYQYRWVVPYDGRALFGRGLHSSGRTPAQVLENHASGFEAATDKTSGMYMGNQVCLATPWLFNYVQQPSRTQHYVRSVMESLYGDGIDHGLPGNDDLGTLSGWYISAALGLAPTIPAVPIFLLNTPFFSNVVINRLKVNIGSFRPANTTDIRMENLLSNKRIKITTEDSKNQKFITGFRLKKAGGSFVSQNKSYVKLSDLQEGAELDFSATGIESQANWAKSADSRPPSMSKNKTRGSNDVLEYGSDLDTNGLGSIEHSFALPVR